MTQPIRSILVVGGGTAGWMTAALLRQAVPADACAITLIESPAVGTIGVGEATVPPLIQYLAAVGLDEADFMARCSATFKLGIRFVDWVRPGREVWHPFGSSGGWIDGIPLFHHWLRARQEGVAVADYHDYALQAVLGDAGRGPRPLDGDSEVTRQGGYAYHLDAAAFAACLAEISVPRGVRHLQDEVTAVDTDEGGCIRRVITEAHGSLAADLYIDCTGFRGLLLGQALGEPWESWSDRLLCDRAAVVAAPAMPAPPASTAAVAREGGWVWRIPLTGRTGCGYVYSSSHVDDDTAARTVLEIAGVSGGAAEPRFLPMRIGRRRRFWVVNCVAICLAAGFVEPLESTGLFLIQRGIELLAGSYFPDTGFAPALAERYNARMGEVMTEIRDFIILHYLLSARDDTPFWRDSRGVAVPESLGERLALYDQTALVEPLPGALFRETSWYAVLAGFGRFPERPRAEAAYSRLEAVSDVLARIRRQHRERARTYPAHGDLLRHLTRPAAPPGTAPRT